MRVRLAVRKARERLNGLLGRAVYRETIPANDKIELRSRLERTVRAAYEGDGFEIRVEEFADVWFLRVQRGLTAGFGVGMLPETGRTGEERMMVGVTRTSRLDEIAGLAVGVLAVLATVLSVMAVGVAGWQLPGVVLGAIALGTAVVTLITVYQIVIPAVAAFEYLGGGRFDGAQIAAAVELVRGVVATCSHANARLEATDPPDR